MPIHEDLDFGQTIRGLGAGQVLFGRYQLECELGRGGMGVVWKAWDQTLERHIALKMLPEVVARDAVAIDELKRETRKCLSLTHSHIVHTYDFVEDAQSAGIAMEYIEGATLSELRIQKPNRIFEPEDILPWIEQVVDALDYAHNKKKIVHRDLKPANIMIEADGDAKVADFGIASSLSDSVSRLTRRSDSSGTLAYMSPQQALGNRPKVTDDVYALGATLYELLTSKPPFFSGELYAQIREVVPQSMAERRQDLEIENGKPIPEAWESAIAAALAKKPEDRPQGVRELLELLQGVEPSPNVAEPEVKSDLAAPEPEPQVGEDDQLKQEPLPQQRKPEPAKTTRQKPGLNKAVALHSQKSPKVKILLLVGLTLVGVAVWIWAWNQQPNLRSKHGSSTDQRHSSNSQDSNIPVQSVTDILDPKFKQTYTNSLGMKFSGIEPGTFMMGSPESEEGRESDETQHEVTLTNGFWMGQTEVTQEQFEKIMGYNPSQFKGKDLPVENVSWMEAVVFCYRLNYLERESGGVPSGFSYHLPTEAQWEYAARARSTEPFKAGQKNQPKLLNSNPKGILAVGSSPENSWGLMETQGNVWEWTWDSYNAFKSKSVSDPSSSHGNRKVIKGGSWGNSLKHLRFASRQSYDRYYRSKYLGFRIMLSNEERLNKEVLTYSSLFWRNQLRTRKETPSSTISIVSDLVDRNLLSKYVGIFIAMDLGKTELARRWILERCAEQADHLSGPGHYYVEYLVEMGDVSTCVRLANEAFEYGQKKWYKNGARNLDYTHWGFQNLFFAHEVNGTESELIRRLDQFPVEKWGRNLDEFIDFKLRNRAISQADAIQAVVGVLERNPDKYLIHDALTIFSDFYEIGLFRHWLVKGCELENRFLVYPGTKYLDFLIENGDDGLASSLAFKNWTQNPTDYQSVNAYLHVAQRLGRLREVSGKVLQKLDENDLKQARLIQRSIQHRFQYGDISAADALKVYLRLTRKFPKEIRFRQSAVESAILSNATSVVLQLVKEGVEQEVDYIPKYIGSDPEKGFFLEPTRLAETINQTRSQIASNYLVNNHVSLNLLIEAYAKVGKLKEFWQDERDNLPIKKSLLEALVEAKVITPTDAFDLIENQLRYSPFDQSLRAYGIELAQSQSFNRAAVNWIIDGSSLDIDFFAYRRGNYYEFLHSMNKGAEAENLRSKYVQLRRNRAGAVAFELYRVTSETAQVQMLKNLTYPGFDYAKLAQWLHELAVADRFLNLFRVIYNESKDPEVLRYQFMALHLLQKSEAAMQVANLMVSQGKRVTHTNHGPFNKVCWVISTSGEYEPNHSNTKIAVELGTMVNQFNTSNWWGSRDTLAAAYAFSGRFEMARRSQIAAVNELKRTNPYSDSLEKAMERLKTYSKSKPWLEL